jgi:hypothetical protein
VELVAVLSNQFKRTGLFRNFAHDDLCGTNDIGCADYISMIEMTTQTAQKQIARRTIAFVNMPALRARPTRITRIDGDHRHSREFCFVIDESARFSERPLRHLVWLSLPEPNPFADTAQIFQCDTAIDFCSFSLSSASRAEKDQAKSSAFVFVT